MKNEESIIKVGIVSEFDGYIGKILTPEQEYTFLDSDIINKEDNIQAGDYVKFRAEGRSYFVEKSQKN